MSDPVAEIADAYRRWADIESARMSAIYSAWAHAIADDGEVLVLLAALPAAKRQPNLIFAAARVLGSPVGDYEPWRDWLLSRWDEVAPIVMSRRTQTNEAARCATLMPLLSRIPGPIALIEVGASAGLCLHPDRYGYRYATESGVVELHPPHGPSDVVIDCDAPSAAVPIRMPDVAWRVGIDLDPVDVTDPEQAEWLEALIWPEHDERRRRLRAAITIAAADPAPVVQGDLFDRLPSIVEAVPEGVTPVVFHSAVAMYLDADGRQRLRDLMTELPGHWISNEAAPVFPEWIEPHGLADDGRFVLALDGIPIAHTGPHGQSIEPLAAWPR